jgi:hypothetical protein
MTTFSALVDSTVMYLAGFTNRQDAATHLTVDMTSSDTTITVADTTGMSTGLLEIDNEMLWCDSVGATTLSIPPYGRGFRGSTAVLHTAGTRVASAPLFPRFLVRAAINDAIQSIFPNVNAIGTTTFTFNPAITTYQLPAGAQSILSVSWQSIGPSREWAPVRRWRLDSSANTTAFTSGSTISLYDGIVPGRTVQVVYQMQPVKLTNDVDEFATVTGLPASCEDLVRLGAAYRLVPFLDSPHLAGNTAEADFSSNMRPVGSAGTLGKQLLQMYRIRLEEEALKQDALFPVRSHYTR